MSTLNHRPSTVDHPSRRISHPNARETMEAIKQARTQIEVESAELDSLESSILLTIAPFRKSEGSNDEELVGDLCFLPESDQFYGLERSDALGTIASVRDSVREIANACGKQFIHEFLDLFNRYPYLHSEAGNKNLLDNEDFFDLHSTSFEDFIAELSDQAFSFACLAFRHHADENHKAKLEIMKQAAQDFKRRVLERVDAGELPQSAKENLIQCDRLEFFADWIDVRDDRTGCKPVGLFAPEYLEIAVFPWAKKEHWQMVFEHEAYHALAGRGLTLQLRRPEGVFPGHFFKQGVQFFKREGAQKEANHFSWLDEAITESLTSSHKVGNKELSFAYKYERAILRKLTDFVDKELFLEAYFEHANPALDSKPLPAWERLKAEVDAIFGKGFLLALDREVRDRGAFQVLNRIYKFKSATDLGKRILKQENLAKRVLRKIGVIIDPIVILD